MTRITCRPSWPATSTRSRHRNDRGRGACGALARGGAVAASALLRRVRAAAGRRGAVAHGATGGGGAGGAGGDCLPAPDTPVPAQRPFGGTGRSEESRVGKECVHTCESGWSPTHSKTKHNHT